MSSNSGFEPSGPMTPDHGASVRPRTRLAKFLAKIAGVYSEQIEPKTEVEKYLDQIALSGGGGSGGGGLPAYTVDDIGRALVVAAKPIVLVPAQRVEIYSNDGQLQSGFDATEFAHKTIALCTITSLDGAQEEECQFDWDEENSRFESYDFPIGTTYIYPDGRISMVPKTGIITTTIILSDLTTTAGSTEAELKWVIM